MKIFEGVRKAAEFTLIELLVVIAIIGILASMLMPALNRARTAAYRIGSVSNMRQIVTSMYYYADDHSGVMPFSRRAGWNESHGGYWRRSTIWYWSRQLVTLDYMPNPFIFWPPGRRKFFAGDPPGGWPGYRSTPIEATTTVLGDAEPYLNWRDGIDTSGIRGPSTSSHGRPLRLGEGIAPPAGAHLVLTEGWEWRQDRVQGSGIGSTRWRNRGGTNCRWNYDGLIPRAYVDGRAFAGGRVDPDKPYIHDRVTDTFATPHPDDLGWDPNYEGPWWDVAIADGRIESPHVMEIPSPTGGFQIYTGANRYRDGAPWFTGWRSGDWIMEW